MSGISSSSELLPPYEWWGEDDMVEEEAMLDHVDSRRGGQWEEGVRKAAAGLAALEWLEGQAWRSKRLPARYHSRRNVDAWQKQARASL